MWSYMQYTLEYRRIYTKIYVYVVVSKKVSMP